MKRRAANLHHLRDLSPRVVAAGGKLANALEHLRVNLRRPTADAALSSSRFEAGAGAFDQS